MNREQTFVSYKNPQQNEEAVSVQGVRGYSAEYSLSVGLESNYTDCYNNDRPLITCARRETI